MFSSSCVVLDSEEKKGIYTLEKEPLPLPLTESAFPRTPPLRQGECVVRGVTALFDFTCINICAIIKESYGG